MKITVFHKTHEYSATWAQSACILLLLFSGLALTGCNGESNGSNGTGQTLRVWAHAGQAAERSTLQSQVDRFNISGASFRVELTLLPERSYNAQVQAAALAGDLPDLLELDGPYLFNYIWQGHLSPLDGVLSEETVQDLIPSIVAQGGFRNKLYGVGTFDSGLGLYARRSLLIEAGIRIPSDPNDAWTIEEFDNALQRLAEYDSDGAVLDLKLNYPDEWFTYAFSPTLQSAGADLIERRGYKGSDGVLNSPDAILALRHIQAC